jgi:hypothetical protein
VRIALTKPLFAWDCLEDSPSLRTVGQFLQAVPDGSLLASLKRFRGRGRNDYPVHVLWGTVLLKTVLRHTTLEGCLGELRRNRGLRRLIGIQSEEGVPKKWNVSRFLGVLGTEPHRSLLREVFDAMVGRLADTVADLGAETAGDATGLSARRSRSEERRTEPELPVPAGGRKEYTDERGKVTRVVEWFGYKLHVLVDRRHEVVLSYRVSETNRADSEILPHTVGDAQRLLPEGRMNSLAYDRAADTEGVHRLLHEVGVAPLIENRSLWSDERERMLPGHDGRSNVVYDEAGTLYCYDRVRSVAVRHRMAYMGHEAARGTLKYRCPARHEGWRCPSDRRCNGGRKYGLTQRVKREIDLRRFPPVPRATKKFERLYRERSAVERVLGRLEVFWGVDDGNIAGGERFHAMVGVVMVTHAGLATLLASAPRREGTLGKMRLSPIARALQAKWRAQAVA